MLCYNFISGFFPVTPTYFELENHEEFRQNQYVLTNLIWFVYLVKYFYKQCQAVSQPYLTSLNISVGFRQGFRQKTKCQKGIFYKMKKKCAFHQIYV